MSKEYLTPLVHTAQNRCFGCGPANPIGLHLDFFVAEDRSVVSMPTVADTFEGPPALIHGGIIAVLLDEAMSKAVRVHGLTAMTRQMEIKYLKPVPSAIPIRIEGRLIRSEGRKHWTQANILNEKSVTLATAKGLFIEVRTGRIARGRSEDRPEVD